LAWNYIKGIELPVVQFQAPTFDPLSVKAPKEPKITAKKALKKCPYLH